MQSFQCRLTIVPFALVFLLSHSVPILADKIATPGQAFVQAARVRHYAEVARILKAHPELVNAQSEERSKGIESHYSEWTALHWAVENDDRMMVDLLLQYKANPNLKTEYGAQPLERAKSREVAAKLIDAGADVNGIGQFGQMPLHVAKSAAIADLLIERGASIDARNQGNDTPLHHAVHHGFTAVALTLIGHGAHIDCKGSQDESPLFGACASGNVQLARRLIDLGADIHAQNTIGVTPLWKCASGHLCSRGISDAGHCEIMKLLVARGAILHQTKNDGSTLLHESASRCFVEVTRYLLDSGLNVNDRDEHGKTPLHSLTDRLRFNHSGLDDGSAEIAMTELLLANGADVTALASIDLANESKKMTPYQLLLSDPYLGTSAEGITMQLAGYPGELESHLRMIEITNRTRQKVAAILRKHGAK